VHAARCGALVSAAGLAAGLTSINTMGQSASDTVDAHVAAAKAAAGQYHSNLFNALCATSTIRPAPAPQTSRTPSAAQAQRPNPPERAQWYAEPVKVFDNLYFVIVSHGHRDHSGGAKFLQDRFGARVLMSAADWDLLDRNTTDPAKPRRDMVVTDGQKLTLGDTTLTF
jgi:Metallo-beta-lactamase superfamily